MRIGTSLFTSARVVIFLVASVLVGGATICNAAADQTDTKMDIIWAESDGLRYEIFTSSYRAGTWGEPVMITDDNAANLHPSIDVGDDGKKWAVWSAIDGLEFEIRYSVFENEEWQEAKTILTGLSSNIKPSIIIDSNSIPWVVWSGNNGDTDDIYYSRYVDGEWTEEKRIHDINSVPDILPFLDTDAEGNPVVTWDRFIDGSYKKRQSTWDGETWSSPSAIAVEEETLEDPEDSQNSVPLPEFVSDTRHVFLRVIESEIKENQ
jgi:hypothetical protein